MTVSHSPVCSDGDGADTSCIVVGPLPTAVRVTVTSVCVVMLVRGSIRVVSVVGDGSSRWTVVNGRMVAVAITVFETSAEILCNTPAVRVVQLTNLLSWQQCMISPVVHNTFGP